MSEQSKPENTDGEVPDNPAPNALVLRQEETPQVNELAGGRRLAIAAFAVAAVAAAGAIYVWQESADSRNEAMRAQAVLEQRIAELEKSGNQAGQALVQAQQGSDEALRQSRATQAGLDEVRTRLARDRSEWLIAEADYLLAIANRKLRFERDVNAAITALEEADARLGAINDSSLIPVRSTLARDLNTLKRITPVDRTGIALQLSALIQGTADLPFARGIAGPAPASAAAERPAITDVSSFFGAVWHDIRGLVTIRRMDAAATPLLPPDQRYFLRHNLVLKLDTARLALLQREPAVYEAALGEAQGWMSRYFDVDVPAVRTSLDAVARLRAIEIAPKTMPHVDETLHTLRRVKRELSAEGRGGAER